MGRLTLTLLAILLQTVGGDRVIESVVPALSSGRRCISSVQLQNLGDRTVAVDLEGHRESGALAPLAEHPAVTVALEPRQVVKYRLNIPEETDGAWVRVRERITPARPSPVVAVTGTTECFSGDQIRTAAREVAYPMRNPWLETDTAGTAGGVLTLVNASAQPVTAAGCYSAGNLYSVPSRGPGGARLLPVCSSTFQILIPPFATRQLPVTRDSSTHFSLKTVGAAIVLQLLRPAETGVRIFTVDSSIKFGGEVVGR